MRAFSTPLRPRHSKFPRITANHSKKISKVYKYTFWGNVYLLYSVLGKVRREGENNEILPSMKYRWPEGAFMMHRVREKKAWVDVRAAGMQSMLTRLIFLRGCALANDGLLTCYTGVKCWVRKSLSVPSVELWVKAQKWRGCQTAQKEGRRGWKCWTEGKKRLLIQKN